jgi:hypothetical protein
MMQINPRHPESAKRIDEAAATAHCIVIDYTFASFDIQPTDQREPKPATLSSVFQYVAQMMEH